MPRDFTIPFDQSRLSGSVSGNTVNIPVIQQVNGVPSLKNTGYPYTIVTGDITLE